jgi:hypothetical protein
MQTTVDSEQVRPRFVRLTAESRESSRLRGAAGLQGAAGQPRRPLRMLWAIPKRSAAVRPTARIWALGAATRKRLPN